jgi:Ca-activated chloride channel family protein
VILSSPVRLFIPVFLICLGLNAIGLVATGQFTSGVSLVEVYATVVDEKGDPVSGLAADDFIVEEDGRRQQIEAFAAGDFPLSLAVAVDRSFSVPATRLRDEVYAVQRLLGELRDEDRVLVMAIGSEVEVVSPLGLDHRAAYDAVRDLQPWGTTPLFDATLQAVNTIQGASGRRALIVMSDGNDRYSTVSASDLVEQARRRDVLVYPVVLQRSVPTVLADLAKVTGARAVAVPDSRSLGMTLSAIATELRTQYLLGYAPAPAGSSAKWRSISVRVTRPGLRVRARDGYVPTR